MLLFVTSSERPFSESEAVFLRAIRRWRKKVLFVLNKADLLSSDDDLDAVVQYVTDNVSREVGVQEIPVVPVAARTAMALKLRRAAEQQPDGAQGEAFGIDLLPYARDAAEQLAASQWSRFESLVLRVIGSDERTAHKLRSGLSLAGAVLSKYEARQAAEGVAVAEDGEAIEEARRRTVAWEEGAAVEMEAQRARVQLVMGGLSQRGVDFLSGELQLGNLPRLLYRDDFTRRFEEVVLADTAAELRRAVASVAEWMDGRAAAQARATAELLDARMRRSSQEAALASVQPEAYHARRQLLLLQLQESAAKTMARYDSRLAAERMLTSARTSLAQAALLTGSAVGVSGLVAVKAAALVDFSGLLPAALLAVTGASVMPYQRYRLQRELRDKVKELSSQLDDAVLGHLQQELASGVSRSMDLIAPFAALAESCRVAHYSRTSELSRLRTQLEGLADETKQIGRGKQRDGAISPEM